MGGIEINLRVDYTKEMAAAVRDLRARVGRGEWADRIGQTAAYYKIPKQFGGLRGSMSGTSTSMSQFVLVFGVPYAQHVSDVGTGAGLPEFRNPTTPGTTRFFLRFIMPVAQTILATMLKESMRRLGIKVI